MTIHIAEIGHLSILFLQKNKLGTKELIQNVRIPLCKILWEIWQLAAGSNVWYRRFISGKYIKRLS